MPKSKPGGKTVPLSACGPPVRSRQNKQSALADRLQELHSDQVHIASFLLALYPGLNRGHPCGNQSGGSDGGCRDRKRHNLIYNEGPRTGNKSTESTDIKGLSKLQELLSMSVLAADKQRHLQINALKSPMLVIKRR